MASNLTLSTNSRPAITRSQSHCVPTPPIAPPQLYATETKDAPDAVLELIDGTAFCGISFGAQGKSVAGECVFQTGAHCLHPTLTMTEKKTLAQGWSGTPNRSRTHHTKAKSSSSPTPS